MCSLIVKGVLGVIFMMWLRWTLPRLRIDQVMTTCLKYCVPLASIMLVGTMVSMFVLRGGIPRHSKAEEPPVKQNKAVGCQSSRSDAMMVAVGFNPRTRSRTYLASRSDARVFSIVATRRTGDRMPQTAG